MIDYAVFSDKGEREINEDMTGVVVNPRFITYGFLLADGLGGHGQGGEASRFAVGYAGAMIENTDDFDDKFIERCYAKTQEMLLMEQQEKGCPQGMKTTLNMLLLDHNKVTWGHVGDSRTYFFREGKLVERTRDHSLAQMLYEGGKIREREIRQHPDRSKLLRVMGTEWSGKDYEIDRRNVRIIPGDAFLLCSDGFWEWLDERAMSRILKKVKSAQEAISEMASIIQKNGNGKNMDNYSAILVLVK